MSNKRFFQFPRPYVFVPMAVDFLHHGHINILIKAKKYGNVIVGLMTDNGIKSYKGRKPIISFKNRLKILNHINMISYILPLPGLKYTHFAKKFKFNYFVHGSDWKKNVQSEQRKKLKIVMKNWGGKVIDIPYTANISSSKIKNLLK
jgi:phosphoenolpyruvate phosphomutase